MADIKEKTARRERRQGTQGLEALAAGIRGNAVGRPLTGGLDGLGGVGLRSRRSPGTGEHPCLGRTTQRLSAEAVLKAQATRQRALDEKLAQARERAARKTQRLQAFAPSREGREAAEDLELDPSFDFDGDDFQF